VNELYPRVLPACHAARVGPTGRQKLGELRAMGHRKLALFVPLCFTRLAEMKRSLFVSGFLFLCALVTGAENIRTIDGKEYKNITVSRAEPDGIVIKVSYGIIKIPFEELSTELQRKYNYNPDLAQKYRESHRPQTQTASPPIPETEPPRPTFSPAQKRTAEQARYDQEMAKREADARDRSSQQWLADRTRNVFATVSRFEKDGAWASITYLQRENVGHHNEGLNIVQDYEWKPQQFGAHPGRQFFIEGEFDSNLLSGATVRLVVYDVGAIKQVGSARYTKLFTDPAKAYAYVHP
jgi:hypothetical protein